MGPGPVHIQMRALEWCIVASTHQDFESRSEKHPLFELYQPGRLKALQEEAYVRMNKLRLSMCSGGNQGTSNNGPTAKSAFEDPELMADVFKIPVWMTRGIRDQLRALTCGEDIDPEMFCAMGQTWLDKFHYGPWDWNTLTPTMHVLFWHVHKMIILFPYPIGFTSEEGSEGDNKVVRADRAHHTPQKGLGPQLKALGHRSLQKANPKILRLTPEPKRPERSLESISHYLATPRPPLQPPKDLESEARSSPTVRKGPSSEVRGGGDNAAKLDL